MSLLTSARGGDRDIGQRRLWLVTAACCLVPAVLGAALYLGIWLQAPRPFGDEALIWIGWATFLALSPLLTLPSWVVLALAARWLMRRGAYGALPAFALGASVACGTVMFLDFRFQTGTSALLLMVLTGGVAALIHRMGLALLRPLAF